MSVIPSELDNYLLAISRAQVAPQQEFSVIQPTSKHMKLYSSVALLLVRVKRDNFAVSSLTTVKDGLTTRSFYYTRNQPAKDKEIGDEKKYLDNMLTTLETSTTVEECQLQLMKLSLSYCRFKTESRLGKLVGRWRLLLSLPQLVAFKTINPTNQPGNVCDPIDPSRILSGQEIPKFLENWLNSLAKLKAPTPKDLALTIAAARNIIRQTPFLNIISDGSLKKYIEKLADYALSASRLAQAKFHHRDVKITIKEIQAPEPPTILFNLDLIGVFNAFTDECNEARTKQHQLPNYDVESLMKIEPQLKAFSCTNLSMNHTVHCECTLAAGLLLRLPSFLPLEIGVSKQCCWACAQFLDILSQYLHSKGRGIIKIARCHLKTYAGWKMPNIGHLNVDEALIAQRLVDAAKGRLMEILIALWQRRRFWETKNRRSASLLFLQNTKPTRANPVQAYQLAKVLRKYAIRRVIINACQSAPPIHNFSRTLVQEGIPTVLGTQFKLLETAAEIMTTALYQDLLAEGRSMLDACSYARSKLREFPQRRTNYNTTVKRSKDPVKHPAIGIDVDERLLGRELSILDLENGFLAISNLVFLTGPAGTGKIALADHHSWWWEATGLICNAIRIDFADFKSKQWIDVVQSLSTQIESSELTNEEHLVRHLQKNRHLVIFDSINALGSNILKPLLDGLLGFSKAIKRFKKSKPVSLILFLSRETQTRIRSVAGSQYSLKGLDIFLSLCVCFKLLENSSKC
ncbi:MAG: hypothetical protein M1829_002811 [Trizodia sp. TS-e1964]|nr:MAG: hypothetical protein M1829_002811 [Trizodia sp. TS-e1964]